MKQTGHIGNIITQHQLRELLQSLPRPTAPPDLEDILAERISSEHLNVAHTLASLSPVPAHPDLHERLSKAISEIRRTGTVIPDPFASGTTFATWLKSISWVRTGAILGTTAALIIGSSAVYHDISQQQTPSADPVPAVQRQSQPETLPSAAETHIQSAQSLLNDANVNGSAQPPGRISDALAVPSTRKTHEVTNQSTIDSPVIEPAKEDTPNITPSASAADSAAVPTQQHGPSVSPDTYPNDSVDTGGSVDTGDNNEVDKPQGN